MKQKIQRSFFPGDQWLFFKIYVGLREVDSILIDTIAPYIKRLFKKHYIDKWFFIRYSDPDYHIRLRVHVSDFNAYGIVITLLHSALNSYIKSHIISKVVIDTYVRELERYGQADIDTCESFFQHDSALACNTLQLTQSESILWQSSILFIQELLINAFNSDLERNKFLDLMSKSYCTEFGYDLSNQKNLNAMYRKYRSIIDSLIAGHITDSILIQCNESIIAIATKYRLLASNNNILSSLIHMHFNRLFTVNQRKYELIIYYFMSKSYKSMISRALKCV